MFRILDSKPSSVQPYTNGAGALTAGTLVTLSSGVLAACGGSTLSAVGILTEDADANATGVLVEKIDGRLIEVDYTSTAPTAYVACDIASGGLLVANTTSNPAFLPISVDTTAKKCKGYLLESVQYV